MDEPMVKAVPEEIFHASEVMANRTRYPRIFGNVSDRVFGMLKPKECAGSSTNSRDHPGIEN